MKKFEKTWQTEYQGIRIEVRNFWNPEKSGETVYINGRVVHQREISMENGKICFCGGVVAGF